MEVKDLLIEKISKMTDEVVLDYLYTLVVDIEKEVINRLPED